jgi:hypothetical protein
MQDSLMRFDNFNKLIFSGLIQFLEVFWGLVVGGDIKLQIERIILSLVETRHCLVSCVANIFLESLSKCYRPRQGNALSLPL